MTKLNSKRLTKSTFAVIVLAIAMVAMLAFGGTYAYFTATSDKVTSTRIHTAKVALGAISNVAEINLTGDIVSGKTILASTTGISVANTSSVETYIFIRFEGTYGDSAMAFAATHTTGYTEFVLTEDTTWTKVHAYESGEEYIVYGKKVAANATATIAIGVRFYGDANSVYTSSSLTLGTAMDKAVTLSATATAIQSVGEDEAAFNDAAAAYAAGGTQLWVTTAD